VVEGDLSTQVSQHRERLLGGQMGEEKSFESDKESDFHPDDEGWLNPENLKVFRYHCRSTEKSAWFMKRNGYP
jgi:hypothetical protein